MLYKPHTIKIRLKLITKYIQWIRFKQRNEKVEYCLGNGVVQYGL